MSSENTAKSPIKKDKKSKRKSVGDAAPKIIEVDTSVAPSSSKPMKKKRTEASTNDPSTISLVEEKAAEPEQKKQKNKSKKEDQVAAGAPEAATLVVDANVEVSEVKKQKKKAQKEKSANGGATEAAAPPAEEKVEVPDVKKQKKKSQKEKPVAATEIATPLVEEKTAAPKMRKPRTKGKKEPAASQDAPAVEAATKAKKVDVMLPPITQASPIGAAPTQPKLKSISAPRKSTSSPSKPEKPANKSKRATKAPSLSPEPVVSEEETPDRDNDADSGDDDEDVHLHGFSTDDDDSSDEEDAMDTEPSVFDVSKLPTIAKDDATVKRKLDKAKRQPTEDRGVLFLGRLPHGFYEDQLKAYFSQFGTVTRLRLSRNKKTGRSKHYGFLEFDSSSVAQIVADTMDNYLLMGHIMRCKVIPKDEVHPELWVGANRKWRAVPQDRLTRVEHNKPRTEDEQVRAAKRLIKRQNDRKRKLADAGIKYDFEAVSYKKVKEAEV